MDLLQHSILTIENLNIKEEKHKIDIERTI